MRKVSHILLANHIMNQEAPPTFVRYKWAFYYGSILPDIKPSFVTKRHEIGLTFYLVESKIEKLDKWEDRNSVLFYLRLGETIHYLADYFTFPHNREYQGSMREHCFYEGRLKHRLRVYVKQLNINKPSFLDRVDMGLIRALNSPPKICDYIKHMHREYILNRHHTIDLDCRYITDVCTTVVLALLQH